MARTIIDIQSSTPTQLANSTALVVPTSPPLAIAAFFITVGDAATGTAGNVILEGTEGWFSTLLNPTLRFSVVRSGSTVVGTVLDNATGALLNKETSFHFVDHNVAPGTYLYQLNVELTSGATTGAQISGPITLIGTSYI